jgi:uncharacterized protein YlaI
MAYLCDACGQKPGDFHVTMPMMIFGPKTVKRKTVQFWLCDGCEHAMAQTLEAGDGQRARVARRLTEFPEYLSRWKDWRTRAWPERGEAKP